MSGAESILESTWAERFSAMFPDGLVDPAGFDAERFCLETSDIPLSCAERLRQLAIWLSAMQPIPDVGWRPFERLYDEARRFDPTDVRVPHSRGITALDFAELAESDADAHAMFAIARASFEEALALAPDDAEIHVDLGLSIYFTPDGEATRALAHFERALELAPDNPRAQLYRAHCLQDRGDFAAAISAYEAVDRQALASALHPWRVSKLREQLALCYLRVGDQARARSLFRETIEAYRAVAGPHLPDELPAFPDELVEAATGELADELRQPTLELVRRFGWLPRYAHLFES